MTDALLATWPTSKHTLSSDMHLHGPQRTLHDRIRGDIEARILSGEWPPGFRIPPETELTAQYACSRMTVNKAVAAECPSQIAIKLDLPSVTVGSLSTKSLVLRENTSCRC